MDKVWVVYTNVRKVGIKIVRAYTSQDEANAAISLAQELGMKNIFVQEVPLTTK